MQNGPEKAERQKQVPNAIERLLSIVDEVDCVFVSLRQQIDPILKPIEGINSPKEEVPRDITICDIAQQIDQSIIRLRTLSVDIASTAKRVEI